MRQPLAGMRVLDLSAIEAGPMCAGMLAWLGADVIKVEPPGIGELGRRSLADAPDRDSTYFLFVNSNKKSVTLNLKHPDGQPLLQALVRSADVLVENLAPGVPKRLGIDYETVQAWNPALIYGSIKGFGASGPYHTYKSLDPIAQAAAGAFSITGTADGPPTKPGPNTGDTGAALHCALGIVAAYCERLQTGKGTLVEISLQEAVVSFMRARIAEALMLGEARGRVGNVVPGIYPTDTFQCHPGGHNDYIMIMAIVVSPHMWDGVLRTIGREDLIGDPQWGDPQWRDAHRDEVKALIEGWTTQRDKQTAMKAFADNGVPCSATLDTMEVLDNSHLRERGMIQDVDHPVRGVTPIPSFPVMLDGEVAPFTPAPLLGHDNADVYGELGFDAAQLAKLKAEGVI